MTVSDNIPSARVLISRAFCVSLLLGATLLLLSQTSSAQSIKSSLKHPPQMSGAIEKAPPAGTSAPPVYQIFDIGSVLAGDNASQGFGVSTGGVAVGRSVRTGAAQAFTWTRALGIVGLPNISGRSFCVSNGANDTGTVVGTCRGIAVRHQPPADRLAKRRRFDAAAARRRDAR